MEMLARSIGINVTHAADSDSTIKFVLQRKFHCQYAVRQPSYKTGGSVILFMPICSQNAKLLVGGI